jgi:hypothetical protein
MITSKNFEMANASPCSTSTKKFVIFWLKDLGSQYKIEKTEDWETCQGDEKSYAEMIRVKDSKPVYRKGIDPLTGEPNRIYYMPSHLYKYSETEVGLYLKDRKSVWPQLAKITEEEYGKFDPAEEDFIFPIEKFPEVAKLIQFCQKRKPPKAFIEARDRINTIRKSTYKGKNKGSNFHERESGHTITSLDSFNGGNPI